MSNFSNFTEIEEMMIRIAYSEGRRMGEKIAEDIKLGKLQIPDNEPIQIIVEKVFEYDFPVYQKVLAKFGSPQFGVAGNLACAGGGVAIGGVSVMKCFKTKNVVAKIFYGTGTICGGTAALAGCLKAYSGTCGLSYFAVGGDMIGGACLYVGNKAQQLGDMIDGKRPWSFRPKSFTRRRLITKTGMGYRGMSFVTSSGNFSFEGVQQIVQNIPYERIIIIGGTVFTVYGYMKLVITIYRYLKSKYYPKIDNSKLIKNSALFLIDSMNKTDSMKRVNRIYTAALKLENSISS